MPTISNGRNSLMVPYEKQEDGFTLIELLVVILIIGILASIAVPVFLNQRKKAVDASLVSDIKSLSLAQENSITAKNQTGTNKGTILRETFATPSNGTTLGTWFNKSGYCVVAYNRNGSYVGNGSDQTTYLWYDSSKGGYVTPPDAATPPLGGACGNPRPPAAEQTWFYADNPAPTP